MVSPMKFIHNDGNKLYDKKLQTGTFVLYYSILVTQLQTSSIILSSNYLNFFIASAQDQFQKRYIRDLSYAYILITSIFRQQNFSCVSVEQFYPNYVIHRKLHMSRWLMKQTHSVWEHLGSITFRSKLNTRSYKNYLGAN